MLLSLSLAACSGGSNGIGPLPSGPTETGAPVASDPAPPATAAGATDAEAAALWEQVLDVFRASEAERADRIQALGARVAPEVLMPVLDASLLAGQAIQLTSNARFEPQGDGSVAIVDCADAVGVSRLGAATAGFVATVAPGPDGTLTITALEPRPNCVQRVPAEAALASYEQFVQNYVEYWKDPSLDSPLLGRYSTAAATARIRDAYTELDQVGLLFPGRQVSDLEERYVEVIRYQQGQIVLRDCRHTAESYGVFNPDGTRADDFGFPWHVQINARMVEQGGQWLFDEVVSTSDGLCELDGSPFGLQPL